MSDIIPSVAVDLGDTVLLHSDKIKYTITKDEYEYARSVLECGIDFDQLSPVITPHDIVGYLKESNPEAENVVTEVSIMRALKGAAKENFKIIAWGFAFFMVIMGFIIAYVVITQNPGSVGTAVSNAASTVSVT